MTGSRILVVDDEPDLRWVLRGLFEDADFEVTEAGDGVEALAAVDLHAPDVVLTDVRMPKMAGLDLLRQLQRRSPDLPVVLLSAVEDIATAVDAIKEGAFDYQAKPYDPQRLLLTVQRAAEQHALRREVVALRNATAEDRVDFGTSAAAAELRRKIELVAHQTSLSVLIKGESGTGKEVVAREIHRSSPVAAGPFVAIDCGAMPEPLMESQLFGHRRGAFTGADRDRPGLFQMADGGTLFLDELGNLPLTLQAKLLRALQERQVVPVGGTEPVPFQARLLCATNAALEREVQRKTFRVDLYHRIAEFTLQLPPLRERPEDIGHFARKFLVEANREMGRQVAGIDESAEQRLRQHGWPGNLRELRNVIRRAVLLCSDKQLLAADLDLRPPDAGPTSLADDAPGGGAFGDGAFGDGALGDGTLGDGALTAATADAAASARALAEAHASDLPLAERIQRASAALEQEILQRTLDEAAGNKAEAARRLQIDYTTLHRKLKRYGLLG